MYHQRQGAAPQRHRQGAGEPAKESRVIYPARDSELKIIRREKLPSLRSRHSTKAYQTEKTAGILFSARETPANSSLFVDTKGRSPGRAVVGTVGGQGFFNKGRKEPKV